MITLDQLLETVNKNLLTEGLAFYQYKALARITYADDPELKLGAEKIAECLRAVPGSTRVSTVSLDKEHNIGIFNVRIISQKNSKDAFISFKKHCLKHFGKFIRKVEIGAGSIETKNFVK